MRLGADRANKELSPFNMNKGCLTIHALSILGALATGIVSAAHNALSIPPPRLTDRCDQLSCCSQEHASLLQYYEWLRSASGETQVAQYECLNSTAKKGVHQGKLVLALTLIVPDTPFADLERAKVLLGDYLHNADKEEPEERGLAALILALLDEVTRTEEKLEQLKEIEKDITETEQSVNVPMPTPTPKEEHEENDSSSR